MKTGSSMAFGFLISWWVLTIGANLRDLHGQTLPGLATAARALEKAPTRVAQAAAPSAVVPSLEQVLTAKEDLWGLAAMRQPDGPSYEFFAELLPPLRYVNATFRHYPIVLSAPSSQVKARLLSNGSAVNARAGLDSWKEVGWPVSFEVGKPPTDFGAELGHLRGPCFERGYLPIVQMSYEHEGVTYQQETFASVEPRFAERGTLFTQFLVSGKKPGTVVARLPANSGIAARQGTLSDTNGNELAWFSDRWKWNPAEQSLVAHLSENQSAVLAIATRSGGPPVQIPFLNAVYEKQHESCIETWERLLGRGCQIEVPEGRVNDAWRALVSGLFILAQGDRLNYSAGNSYERQFEAESGDAVGALLLFGFEREVRQWLPPLLDYAQQGLSFHDAAFKLQLLSQYFWVTRDTNFVSGMRSRWQRAADHISESREPGNGLLPRENYCGDIETQVYSLNSNASSWRGLRDLASVLEAMGQATTARELHEKERAFRKAILAAVAQSERREVQPPFIPVALFGEERPYDVLTASKLGSYWNLIAPYILGSGVFGPAAERERAMIDYLQEHGGVCLGMIRFHQHSGLFANEDALDDLYGLRYTLKLLELDDVERALVSFYGKLAQGLTRDTFSGAEGTGLRPLDQFGRPMYLPPNCTAQAYFLWMLRFLLVQDWDLDDDGEPETLRLCFATPRRWLADGQTIKVQRAPSAFGPLSFTVQSKLSQGEVIAELDLPQRNPPKRTLLRLRLPDGWTITSASADSTSLKVDEQGAVDVSFSPAQATIRFRVSKR